MSTIHLRDVDLNLLVVLQALLATRSVTQAAARLGRTQSAVSYALGRLRALFGDPLLVRVGNAMAPTARAEELAEPLREALAQVERLVQHQERFDPARLERSFVLGATDFAELVVMPGLLARLRAEGPGVSLATVQTGSGSERALAAGELDMALGTFWQEIGGLVRQPLYTERFVCLVPEGCLAPDAPLTLEAWLAADHALIAPRGSAGGVVDRALEAQGLSRRVVYRSPSFAATALVCCEARLMLTLPERAAQVLAARLPLRLAPPPLELPGFVFSVIYHELYRHDPAHRWLRGLMVEVCRAPGEAALY